MKFPVLVCCFIFTFCAGIKAQWVKDSVAFPKHIRQELGIYYDAFYTFGRVLHYSGTYHPVRFDRPITQSYELNYGLAYRHYFIQGLFSSGRTRFYQTLTENLDSSGRTYPKRHHNDAVTSDTFHFHTFGFRVGITGKLKSKLMYSISLGVRQDFFKQHGHVTTIYLFHHFDSTNNTYYFFPRLVINPHLDLNSAEKIEIYIRLHHKLTRAIKLSLNASFCMNPWIIGTEDWSFNARYWFYSRKGEFKEISYGRSITYLTQLHLGLGLSYAF